MTSTTIDRANELKNITFLKCILMLLVVLGHALGFWSGTWFSCIEPAKAAPILKLISSYLGSFHIYGFVLASGYLYAYVRYERKGYPSFGKFIRNKAMRLLLPYAFALTVWVLPITQIFFRYDWKTVLLRFILGEAPGQLWFLLMLFGVFLLVWPLSDLFRSKPFWGLCLSLAFYGLGTIAGLFLPNFFQWKTVLQFVLFFFVGFCLRTVEKPLIRNIHPLLWIALHLGLFALALLIPTDRTIFKLCLLALEPILHLTGACMTFSILQKLGARGNWQTSQLFRFFSLRSMPIYLFHQQVIYVVLFLLNGKLTPYLLAPLCFLSALGVSIGISSLLLLWNPTRVLLGEKPKQPTV